ncbi:MAG: mannitol dehydrogenase family protein, partial [Planctomycetota bacterium]
TEAGYKDFADDLLDRMTNPYLGDTIARVTRDIVRKLEIHGRIFGTMQLAIEHGIEPRNLALGALAGIAVLLDKADEYKLPNDLRLSDWRELDREKIEKILKWLWNKKRCVYANKIVKYFEQAKKHLEELTTS